MMLLRKIRQRIDQRLVLFILNLFVNIIWLAQDDRVLQYASLIVVLFSNFLTAGGWPALKVVLNPIQARRPLLILASLAAPFVLLLFKCIVVGVAWFDEAFPLDPVVAIIDALSSVIIVISLDEKISPAKALRDLAYVAYTKVTKLLLDKVEKPGEFIVVNKLNRPALVNPSLPLRKDFGFLGWLLVYLFASRTILALIVAFAAGLVLAAPTENLLAGLYIAIFVSLFDVLRFAIASWRTERDRAGGGAGNQASGRARLVRAAFGFLVVFFGGTMILSLHFGLESLNTSSAPPMEIAGLRLDIQGVTHGIYLALFLAAYLGVGRSDQTLTTDVGTIDELSPAWGSAILRGLVWGVIGGLSRWQ